MSRRWIINNRYLVLKKMTSGGFATLYKGWDQNLRKLVAIKRIHDKYANDAKFVDMFRKEAINTARFEHENIVNVINFLKDQSGNYYIIMGYVKGVSLQCVMKRCEEYSVKISPVISLYIIREVLKALDYVNNKKDGLSGEPLNIVHRDISPDNVMVFYDGRVKLTDFGIAKAGSEAIRKAKKGKLRGKISYMSPEQAKGRGNVDHRSDLYGCGIVLYEMITGDKLFKGETRSDVWKKVRSAKVDLKELKGLDVDDEIIRIIKKLLRRKPDKRYQKASEVIKEINRYFKTTGMDDIKGELRDLNKIALRREIKHIKKDISAEQSGDIEELIEESKEMEKHKKTKKDKKNEQTKEKSKEVSNGPPPTSPPSGPPPSAPPPTGDDSKAGGEKEKTVVDFVLDTGRKYKKIFISVLLSIFIAFAAYTAIDTYYQVTSWGTGIHNFIWPPALQIDSIPTGAKIRILEDDEDIIAREGYKSETPTHIGEIRDGSYNLELEKDGYGKIQRRITVLGDKKGDQSITIAGAKKTEDQFVVPFEVKLVVKSTPPGADFYLDGRKVGETPFEDRVDIGDYNIVLEKEGFETLGCRDKGEGGSKGVCTIDMLTDIDDQMNIDRRYWTLKEGVSETGNKKLVLAGTLWKNITVTSNPSAAQVFVNDMTAPRGTTPMEELALTVGEHTLQLEKSGYRTWKNNIEVNSQSQNSINVNLRKEITIYAYQKGERGEDINANVSVKGTRINGRTPLKVALTNRNYTFDFSKDPDYKPVTVSKNVGGIRNRLNVFMEYRDPYLKVIARDYETEERVSDAVVWIDGSYWKKTGNRGIASGYIEQPPGNFKIVLKSDDYDDVVSFVDIDKGERKELEMNLGAPKDGTIVVDTTDGFYDTSIYLNGEYQGALLEQISDVPRGTHVVEIRGKNFEQNITKRVEIEEPEDLVILKLEKQNSDIYLTELDSEIYWEEYR
ncbi:MAG: PEGA domain-containing protein [Elusimicrobiota bacterium]